MLLSERWELSHGISLVIIKMLVQNYTMTISNSPAYLHVHTAYMKGNGLIYTAREREVPTHK